MGMNQGNASIVFFNHAMILFAVDVVHKYSRLQPRLLSRLKNDRFCALASVRFSRPENELEAIRKLSQNKSD